MNLSLNHRPAKIICLMGSLIWAWLLIHKYYSLGFYDWDFAFFAQAMWNLSHGSMYNSLFGINFFSNHANLIALILVPLFKIFPFPLTLLMLKLFSFCVASYILYILAEEKLGLNTALVILCLYWLYPSNIYGLYYEFDFESLNLVFLMLLYYFYTKDKWLPFMISSLFLIIIKENMPLIILAFGIHGFCTKSNKIDWGLIPVLLGAASFFVLAFIFVPFMGGHALGHHPYAEHYAALSQNIIVHPLQTIVGLFTPARLVWLVSLFGPFALSFLSPGTLFLVSPIILQHFLSSARQEHNIDYAYTLTIAPFIFLAFINALAWIKTRFSKGKFQLIILMTIAINILNLFTQIDHIHKRYMDCDLTATAPYGWQLLKMVPPQAPVIASFRFLPELSQRAYLYSFHKAYDPVFQNDNYSYQYPKNVHYALIDFYDDWLLARFQLQKDSIRANVDKFLVDGGWKAKYAASGIVLYER